MIFNFVSARGFLFNGAFRILFWLTVASEQRTVLTGLGSSVRTHRSFMGRFYCYKSYGLAEVEIEQRVIWHGVSDAHVYLILVQCRK
jgi:hypothetical protein